MEILLYILGVIIFALVVANGILFGKLDVLKDRVQTLEQKLDNFDTGIRVMRGGKWAKIKPQDIKNEEKK